MELMNKWFIKCSLLFEVFPKAISMRPQIENRSVLQV